MASSLSTNESFYEACCLPSRLSHWLPPYFFSSSSSFRKMKVEMISLTPLWCVHTDPGTLGNKPECAVGIPGLATGATSCGFVFAAIVLVCKISLLWISRLRSQRRCWLRVYLSAILFFLPFKKNHCQDTVGMGSSVHSLWVISYLLIQFPPLLRINVELMALWCTRSHHLS